MNSIFTRRSVRRFTEEKISGDQMEKLLHAGMVAPSAFNQQCWEFLVVENRDSLTKLSGVSPYSSCLKWASAGIVLLGNEEKMTMPEYWQQDLGACAENILIEAVELGLGGVWMGVCPHQNQMDFVSEMFDLPKHIKPFGILAMGHPAKENANNFQDRYSKDRVHFEKF